MKKIILLLGLILFSASASIGAECEYSCVESYDMNNKFSSFFSSITGLNFARTQITEAVLEKAILKSVQGDKDLKVDIKSYSAKDLKNGIFKSLTMKGKNINIDGIYLSSVNLKTLCDFNYIQYDKKDNIVFKEDFPMSFEFEISADDINKTIATEKYGKVINNLNKLSFAGVKVQSTTASIRGNRFYYTINVAIPFVREPKKIEISADLDVRNGEIDFENTKLSSNSFKFDLKKVDKIMNYLNPLNFSINIFKDKDAKVYIKNIAIKNNVIVIDGIVIVPKD